jgi:hypothetical protein
MRKTLIVAALASMAGVGTIAGFSVVARSADHQDAPGTQADPSADINDVFSWMDGNNVVLAMTSNPAATRTTQFSNGVQYVFHTGSAIAFTGGLSATNAVDVIATFDTSTPQNIQVWVGTDYVTGALSATGALTSADGKIKVWAGPVADPFFFNLDGFHSAVQDVVAAEPALLAGNAFNDAGCPTLPSGTPAALVSQLAHNSTLGAPADHFANLDGMGIVVEVDKTLLTINGSDVSVWGATYAAPTSADAGGQ